VTNPNQALLDSTSSFYLAVFLKRKKQTIERDEKKYINDDAFILDFHQGRGN